MRAEVLKGRAVALHALAKLAAEPAARSALLGRVAGLLAAADAAHPGSVAPDLMAAVQHARGARPRLPPGGPHAPSTPRTARAVRARRDAPTPRDAAQGAGAWSIFCFTRRATAGARTSLAEWERPRSRRPRTPRAEVRGPVSRAEARRGARGSGLRSAGRAARPAGRRRGRAAAP